MTTYTRDELIRLCEQAIVPHSKWPRPVSRAGGEQP